MRTVEEIEKVEIPYGKTQSNDSPCELTTPELRHLLAIARAAMAHNCDPYGDVTTTHLDDVLHEARKAGLFGGGK